jgi:hypothetical protein
MEAGQNCWDLIRSSGCTGEPWKQAGFSVVGERKLRGMISE